MVKLLIIDGFNLIRRIHSAVPGDEDTPPHAQGVVQSVKASISRAIKLHQPSHAICVLESNVSTWRHAIYSEYKQGRKPQPKALLANLPNISAVMQTLKVAQISIDRAEANDIIASIAVKVGNQGQCLILSTDHLLAQLTSDHVRQHDHFSGTPIDLPFIRKRYEVDTTQLIDYFSLCGSSSLNIAGVGNKTAAKLINEFSSLEQLLTNTDRLKGKLQQQIINSIDILPLYQRLFTLERSIHLNANLRNWRLS